MSNQEKGVTEMSAEIISKETEEVLPTETVDPASKFGTKDYKRSRGAYAIECLFEYFVSLLITDAFLAKLLKTSGMSDSMIGIVSSLVAFAFLFQLVAAVTVQRIKSFKTTVFICHIISNSFFIFMYVIPFLKMDGIYKQILSVVCILLAYFSTNFSASMLYKWGNSYVDPTKRASYSAVKEMISLAGGIVMTIAVGAIVDKFDAANNMYGGFIFCAIAMLIFAISDLTCILITKKDIKSPEERAEKVSFVDAIKNTLGNRNFRSVVYLTILWDVARYSILGFLGTYRIGELAFTVGAVQLINFASSAVRFVISRPFGRFSDKYSFARGIEIALIIAAFGFGVNAFTTPATRFLIIVETVCYSASLAGANQNLSNITYNYVDSKYFVQASAIKNSIGGLCGFLASLGAARLLDMIQKNGNTFLGMHVYGQQVLSVIACVLLVVAVLYTHFVIAKQKRMVQ